MGLCAIHEVGFYTDHDDAWGCGLHSYCFGVFRMMHFADDAFLMRIHTWCPKKRVLSELLDLALIMGACLNPLSRTPHYLLWDTPYTVYSIGYLYFGTKNSFAEMMFRSIYETKTNLLFSMLKD